MPFRQQDVDAARARQVAAAQSPEGEVRLVAGPGSGKSSTIEERVRWLLEDGVPPRSIAVISFTNASVRDLQARLRKYCEENQQPEVAHVSITTLHSLALRLLQQAHLLDAYPTKPLVLDQWELENIYDEEFGESQGITSTKRRAAIRRYWEAFWSTGRPDAPTYVAADPPITDDERLRFEAFHGPTTQVYSCVLPGEIVRKCVQAAATGAVDIAHLLRARHLIVDEYQDLNPVDLEFIDRLRQAHVSIFVAGDDDQSVYSFRHASPDGIQGFHTRYPAAGLHSLEHCFRCTPSVLGAASALIAANAAPGRIPKRLTSLYATANPPIAGIVHRWRFVSSAGEADGIARSCGRLIEAGLAARDILILLANSNSSGGLWSPLRDALGAAAVPFNPPKEESFIDSEAGRLVLALTRIVCSRDQRGVPQNVVAHRTVLGLKRGVGVGTCDGIRSAVIATPNQAFLDLFYRQVPTGMLSARLMRAVQYARETCTEIAGWRPDDTVQQRAAELAGLIGRTLTPVAVQDWIAASAALPDAMTLEELLAYLSADNAEQRANVLTTVATRAGLPVEGIPELNRVRVMTMHGAKGLSAQVVFIPGLELGLLPNAHQARSAAQRLEAARLLYVSITRARATCVLSFAQQRIVNGQRDRRVASPFMMQVGGPFAPRTEGLTAAEDAAVRQAVRAM